MSSEELMSLNDKIAQRVGENLVDLIPDDAWKQIVDNEINKFKTETLPKEIEAQLHGIYSSKIKSTLDRLVNSTEWDNQTQELINVELEKFIARTSGTIVAGMLSPSMALVMNDLRNRMY